jgi:hypothetical protein
LRIRSGNLEQKTRGIPEHFCPTGALGVNAYRRIFESGAKSSNFLGARASCPRMSAKNTKNAGRMPALPGDFHQAFNCNDFLHRNHFFVNPVFNTLQKSACRFASSALLQPQANSNSRVLDKKIFPLIGRVEIC